MSHGPAMNHFDFFRHDLNLLVAFDALHAEASVSRAAERVGVTQSAMSQSLARLRRSLGDELFTRRAGGIAPTAVADQLAPRIRAALQEIHGVLVHGAVFEPAKAERVFRIAMSDAQQTVLLPPLLAQVRQQAPGVTLQVLAFDRQTAEATLAQGGLDLVVSRFDRVLPGFVADPLYEERHLCLYDPRQARLSSPMTLDEYLAHPHVLLSFGGDLTGVVDRALAAKGRQRRILASTPHAHIVAQLVKSTGALAVLPARIAQQASAWFDLALQTPPVSIAPYRLRLLWHERARHEAGLQWLRAQVLDVAVNLPDVKPKAAAAKRRRRA